MSCRKNSSDDSGFRIHGWGGGLLLKREIESISQMGHLQIVFIFHLCVSRPCSETLGRYLRGKAEPEISRMFKCLRCTSGPRTSASMLNLALSNTSALPCNRRKRWGKMTTQNWLQADLAFDS